MKLVRLIILSIIFISGPCSIMLSQNMVKDKPKLGESVVLFAANENNNNYYITPVVIFKNNKLIIPPVNTGPKQDYFQFAMDYFQPTSSFFKVNSNSSNKEITVKVSPSESSDDGCTFTISTEIKLNNESLKATLPNCLFTNSLLLSKKNYATSIADELTRKKAKELFIKYYQKENGVNKTESFSILKIYYVSINEKTKSIVAKFIIDEKGLDFKKECVVIFNVNGSDWKIVDYKPLFSLQTGSKEWSNSGYNYIDAVDIDFDGNNELIFYYSEGGYGYKILKFVSGKWKTIYFTSDGC